MSRQTFKWDRMPSNLRKFITHKFTFVRDHPHWVCDSRNFCKFRLSYYKTVPKNNTRINCRLSISTTNSLRGFWQSLKFWATVKTADCQDLQPIILHNFDRRLAVVLDWQNSVLWLVVDLDGRQLILVSFVMRLKFYFRNLFPMSNYI